MHDCKLKDVLQSSQNTYFSFKSVMEYIFYINTKEIFYSSWKHCVSSEKTDYTFLKMSIFTREVKFQFSKGLAFKSKKLYGKNHFDINSHF